MMIKLNIFIATFLFITAIPAYSTCYVESDYTAMINDEGIIFGKITSYKLMHVKKGDSIRDLPQSWPEKYVRQYKSSSGDQMCKIGNKTGLEFLGIDKKTGEQKYIVPEEVIFRCMCY